MFANFSHGPPSAWSGLTRIRPSGTRRSQRRVFQTEFADLICDVVRRFDKILSSSTISICSVHSFNDFRDDLDFGEFATGHFDVHLVALKISRNAGNIGATTFARADSPPLVIPEAKMRANARSSGDRFHRAIENIDEAI